MTKKIVWLITCVALVAGLWLWKPWQAKSAGVDESLSSSNAERSEEFEQEVLSFVIDGRSANGVNEWHLEGESAEIVDEIIYLNHLKAVVYGEDNSANLFSDYGVYHKQTGEVELVGNVKVISKDGAVLLTDKAVWSQITKEVSTDEIVRITHEKMVAVGRGGMANSEEKKAMLTKDVKVTIEPDTTVTCDGPLAVDYEKSKAVFYDNVRVEDADGVLFSDKLTVEFDKDAGKVVRVIAEGNVRIKKGKSYTLSEKAVYTDSTKHARLLGNPRVIIDPMELSKFEDFGAIKGKS
ncbi:MAG: LPS export ABC transporter periplasmic protein LptC [Candidatus Omnitrophota bacterium]